MKINGNIFIRKDTVVYSVNCNPMFTTPLAAAAPRRSTAGATASRMIRTAARTSCASFMYVPVAPDGAMDMGPGISKPGDYVDLRAEMDVLPVVSHCPQ